MMATPTDQFADIANRSQEAVTTAVHDWADTVQSLASMVAAGQSQLPNLHSVVDQYFDFAEKMLTSQREFAQQWASATLRATEAVSEQVQRATQSVTARTANSAGAVADNAAETARVAGEQAASNRRAARNAANN
jgi:gas vesicle protein